MGLGKTFQVVAYLAALHHSSTIKEGGVLIVAPKTLLPMWQRELATWCPNLPVQVADTHSRVGLVKEVCDVNGVVICSYESAGHLELINAKWAAAILDEGHRLRNPNSRIALQLKQIHTPRRFLLTGSPIHNNLIDLWSIFDFVRPHALGTLPAFIQHLARPIQEGNDATASPVRVSTAYQCTLAVREATMHAVLRRMKSELIDSVSLPHKREEVLFCHLTP